MDQVEPFLDNWTYLRTELNWLDRLLATAVAHQRKEVKEVDRIARSRADRVTSHWWKGLINVEGAIAGDSPADTSRRRTSSKTSYQQQMDARIQASHQAGIILGLPTLCQRLSLSPFEKNLVVMALAPEVSRRYGKLYNYLQETEQSWASGLPTVDLILRLLCRTDAEWRLSRLAFAATSPLIRYGVVTLPSNQTEPFLSHPVKLPDAFVEFLLAEIPAAPALETLLQQKPTEPTFAEPVLSLELWQPEAAIAPTPVPLDPEGELTALQLTDPWSRLVLPESLMASLHHLSDRLRYSKQVDQDWKFQHGLAGQTMNPGTIALLVGARGTGKTSAAAAIAQSAQVSLLCIDPAALSVAESQQRLQELSVQMPSVLLVKSAQVWFGRSSQVPSEILHRFLQARQQNYTITLLCIEQPYFMRHLWRQQMHLILEFPRPNQKSRLQLWRRAFPESLTATADIDWQELARLSLTGGEIRAIARSAAIVAAAESPGKLTMNHLLQACSLYDTAAKWSGQKQRPTRKDRA